MDLDSGLPSNQTASTGAMRNLTHKPPVLGLVLLSLAIYEYWPYQMDVTFVAYGQTVNTNTTPTPVLEAIDPTSVRGGADAVIVLTGRDFTTNSEIEVDQPSVKAGFNKDNSDFSYLSSTSLRFTLRKEFLQIPGTAEVYVYNHDNGPIKRSATKILTILPKPAP